jgi:hypothetical protein
MISAFDTPGHFYRGNLHGHSSLSDGRYTVEQVCELYARAGYDFCCVTDHFRDKYGFPIADTQPYRAENFTTLIGAELHAPQTSRGVDWHILALGLPLDFEPPQPAETGPALARRAAAAGAFIAIAHPDWYQLQRCDGEALDAAHAVEIYNHTSELNTSRGGGASFYDDLLSAGHRLNCLAVDDSHWNINDAFGAWVMVKAPSNSPEALLEALHNGRFYSTQGPTIHVIHRHSETLTVETSPADHVVLVGSGLDAVVAHGPNRTVAELPLEKFNGRWCRAVVIDAAGRRAWSNPLWLD